MKKKIKPHIGMYIRNKTHPEERLVIVGIDESNPRYWQVKGEDGRVGGMYHRKHYRPETEHEAAKIERTLLKKSKERSRRYKESGVFKYSSFDSIQTLSALTAMLTSMRSCPGKKAKMDVMYEFLRESPTLRWLVRLAYDPTMRIGFSIEEVNALLDAKKWQPSPHSHLLAILHASHKKQIGRSLAAARWASYIRSVEPPFLEVASGIIKKDLRCGLSAKGINKVLKRLGKRTITIKEN